MINSIPNSKYGILRQDAFNSDCDELASQLKLIGYGILDSGYSKKEISEISENFDITKVNYLNEFGEKFLASINEHQTIRAPLLFGGKNFLKIATNYNLIKVLDSLFIGTYILNQQNGVINPPSKKYNQGMWHRDLAYQHFTSSSPLAVNALFCVDDFTIENGTTYVLPASHLKADFPSEKYVKNNAIQVEAKAGQFIILDGLLYHSGGFNGSDKERRGINHVYTIPYFKQQINLHALSSENLSEFERLILGINFREESTILSYLENRASNKKS
jgi:ectoine hydroxylase-related dioxygenase (phytanoyl-CoA dioxygenase family)